MLEKQPWVGKLRPTKRQKFEQQKKILKFKLDIFGFESKRMKSVSSATKLLTFVIDKKS